MKARRLALAILVVASCGLYSRLAANLFLNIGSIFVSKAQAWSNPAYHSLAIRWLTQADASGFVSIKAAAQIWAMEANQGNQEGALPWGEKVLKRTEGERTLTLRSNGSLMSRLCLWSLFRSTGRQQQADNLQRKMQFFDGYVLEDPIYRRSAVLMASRLVREKIWPLDLAHRVLSYALGFPEELALVQTAARNMSVDYPTDAYLLYLVSVSEIAEGQRSAAYQTLRQARFLAPNSFPDCALDIRGVLPFQGDSTKCLWYNSFDKGLTLWDYNKNWVGGEKFWPALYVWQYDRVIHVEGTASLRLSCIWVQPDERRETARAAMMVHLPPLPPGPLRVRFYYRTDGLSGLNAQVWFMRSNTICSRWALPSSAGCWLPYEGVVDWTPDPRPDLVILLSAVGDFWIDALSVERNTM